MRRSEEGVRHGRSGFGWGWGGGGYFANPCRGKAIRNIEVSEDLQEEFLWQGQQGRAWCSLHVEVGGGGGLA